MNFIYELSRILYNSEGINKANAYLRSRGLDPEEMRYSCSVSGSDENVFSQFSHLFPTNVFVDSLYIPILDVTNPQMLIGFDVKYLGDKSFRTRFHKFKVYQEAFMLYTSKNLNEVGDEEPIIVTESFIDSITLEQLGYTVVSPLTALNNLKFCSFIYSISSKIYIMYDSDSTGRSSVSKIMKNVSLDTEIRRCFTPIIYSGKDPNECLCNFGAQYLKDILKVQVGEPNNRVIL